MSIVNQSKKTLLPALLAVGGGLASLPASALELGEVNVHSTLGQPLRASIAFALAPNELISQYCVTLPQGLSNNGLPAIQDARISIAAGVISLTGKTPIREPLLSLRVNVSCPYTPKLSREYMLFVDPALPAQSATTQAPVPVTAATTTAPKLITQAPAARSEAQSERPAARRNTVARTPIDSATQYRVQPGDTLSGIASRIENRPIGLWSAVSTIFDANPAAFINNDPNRLKAGSLLAIPDFGSGVASVASEPVFAPAPAASVATPAAAVATPDVTPADTAPTTKVADLDDTRFLEPATAAAEMQPGDLVLERENPFVDPAEPVGESSISKPTIGIADTTLEAPTTALSPNVPVATVSASPVESAASAEKTNWLLWMIGGGIALLAGLLLFGRRTREFAIPEPFEPEAEHPLRRASDSMTVETIVDPDYELDDDSPTAENLALDADLVVGTGLQDGADMDVHQDFGFAATTDLDLELPENHVIESSSTDMMHAPTIEELTILDSEVLPDDEDYDMSVIIDATKMPQPDEVTEHDLKAVQIMEDTALTENYTVDQEVDYTILEQDYEDEMTATQALNKEIEKAAAEIAELKRHAENDDKTAGMKLASVTELDATSKLPADFEYVSNIDDTGVNADITQELSTDDSTVEMPKSGNDDTVEMPPKSRNVDTKAG